MAARSEVDRPVAEPPWRSRRWLLVQLLIGGWMVGVFVAFLLQYRSRVDAVWRLGKNLLGIGD